MRLHLLHGVERSLTSYNILARECLYALGVGIITALAAICFNYMIHLVQWLCNTMWPQAAWSIPLSVALGGLLVGLLLWWRAKDLNEGGIPGVITSVFAKGGIIPGRVALIRMVTAALTIGSGGSAGREGPIVQIGASLGSKFARVFKLSEHKTILLLACGIDTEKSLFFIQSHVHTHAELAWVLNCYTQFGELSRMTQFKDKSAKHADNVNAGLFAYPSLMAADILLYKSDMVPVGADQKQHLELSRNIAERFNGIYGNTFTVPEPYISTVGARVMSLQDPSKKMSKSDENVNSWVAVLDKPDTIMKKFKRAVTDSEAVVKVGEGKDGINNLIGIMSAVTGKTADEIAAEFEGKGYGDFKTAVAEAVIEEVKPIQARFEEYINNKDYLVEQYRKSAEIAEKISQRTLDKAMKKIGFIAK